MGRSFVYKRGAAGDGVSFNVTPLIDCTFLLIIFFILASQMSSDSLAALQLPRPRASVAAGQRQDTHRLIVNVVVAEGEQASADGAAGQAMAYKIEGRHVAIGDFQTLVGLLRSRREASGGALFLEVRADRRVQFGHVRPVMDAAAEVGITDVNLTALLEAQERS